MYVHNIMCKCVHTGIVLLCGCIAKICCGVVILQQSQCSERCSSRGSVLASSFIEYVSSVLQSICPYLCRLNQSCDLLADPLHKTLTCVCDERACVS